MKAFAILASVAIVASVASKKPRVRKAPKSQCPQLEPGSGNAFGYEYVEVATGGASLDESLPIVFMIHGRAAEPESLIDKLSNIEVKRRFIIPRGNAGTPNSPLWFKLRARDADQDKLASQMGAEADSLSVFISEMNRCLNGVGKPIVTGHSQGGSMTLALAAAHPDIMKAAVSISGWLPEGLWPDAMAPTYAIHGTADITVDYARSASSMESMKLAGLPVKFYRIDNHGHSFTGAAKSAWESLMNSL